MVGDRYRDIEAGARVGVRGILVGEEETVNYQPRVADLRAAAQLILSA